MKMKMIIKKYVINLLYYGCLAQYYILDDPLYNTNACI